MAKEVTEKVRAFWREEIHLWKADRGGLSFSRWCQARDLNVDEMPRPLDPLPKQEPTSFEREPTSYDLKQERRRRRAARAIRRAERKEKKKQNVKSS